MKLKLMLILFLSILLAACLPSAPTTKGKRTITVFGFSIMKEPLEKAIFPMFKEKWRVEHGEEVEFVSSFAGSETITNQILAGSPADIAILSIERDVDRLIKAGHVPSDWYVTPQKGIVNKTPFVILVRKGNPKGIKDWNDLIKPGIEVITPNPKTSGGARWNYLAAYAYILKKELGDLSKIKNPKFAKEVAAAEKKATEFITELFKHVPVLDSGARGSTNTFVQREIGDVLLAWENEAFLAFNELGEDKFDIVVPPLSILAEPPVTVVDKWADKHGTRKVAEEYLKFLYSETGQKLAAHHYYRPVNTKSALPEDLKRFTKLELITVDDVFGGWTVAQKKHFSDGGIFDQIYQPGK